MNRLFVQVVLVVAFFTINSHSEIGIRTDIVSVMKPTIIKQDNEGRTWDDYGSYEYTPARLIPIYVPFLIGKVLRVEPMIGFAGGMSVYDGFITAGIGLLYKKTNADNSSFQIGERYYFSNYYEDRVSSFATCAGGEYTFAHHIGVSLECQLRIETDFSLSYGLSTYIPIYLTYYF